MWTRRGPDEAAPYVPLKLLSVATRDRSIAAIRAACRVAPLSHQRAVCRVLGRYLVVVDLRDMGLAPHLMLDGFWEMWITEAIRQLVRPGMSCVDVGANLGYHTLLLSDLVGPSGQVHAFEPNPDINALLKHSIALNGFDSRITVHDRPVSNRPGISVTLVALEEQPKNAHLMHAGSPVLPGSTVHALTTTTLDECMANRPVDLVKIDAEGAEQDVWRGMRDILARDAPIQVILEFTADRYADPAAFLLELMSPGLRLSFIDHIKGIQPTTPGQVLAAPKGSDQTLLLTRG